MKLLLVDDEPEFARSIIQYLREERYVCTWAATYTDASRHLNDYAYDCVVVDIGLPDGSGLALISELKARRADAGIIVVSARNSLDDKLAGLDLGADDYLTKPFHLAELNSRIKSVLRRRLNAGNSALVFDELRIEADRHAVLVAGDEVPLTRKEFDILLFLAINRERVLAKESILEHVWGDEANAFDTFDLVYTHMKNLRKKLTAAGARDRIHSVYGIGYKFTTA